MQEVEEHKESKVTFLEEGEEIGLVENICNMHIKGKSTSWS